MKKDTGSVDIGRRKRVSDRDVQVLVVAGEAEAAEKFVYWTYVVGYVLRVSAAFCSTTSQDQAYSIAPSTSQVRSSVWVKNGPLPVAIGDEKFAVAPTVEYEVDPLPYMMGTTETTTVSTLSYWYESVVEPAVSTQGAQVSRNKLEQKGREPERCHVSLVVLSNFERFVCF